MKRKAIAFMLAAGMVAAMAAGCGTGESGSQNVKTETEKTAEISTATTEEPEAEEKQEEGEAQPETAEAEEKTKDSFSRFEEELSNSGITYEKVVMAAELIGAKQGIKYKIGEGAVELYRYDIESDAYKEAEETQSTYMEGFGAFPAVVKNGYALLISGLDEAQYKEIFEKIAE